MNQKTDADSRSNDAFVDRNGPNAELAPILRETSSSGLESQTAVRRYSDYSDKGFEHGRNGEAAMDFRYHELTTSGYRIVWASGSYCRAQRDGVDILLRWNGHAWVVM
jgi:hypothetical protein